MELTAEQQAHLDATKQSIKETIESHKEHFDKTFPDLKFLYVFDCEAQSATLKTEPEATPEAEK